jgi:uncharacterized membrane protein YcaP (DUF421 family)
MAEVREARMESDGEVSVIKTGTIRCRTEFGVRVRTR